MSVLVLLRVHQPDPLPPEARAIGRAALALEREGVPVLFGGAQGAWRPRPGGWLEADPGDARAIYDRFPAWTWPGDYRAALAGLEDRPIANPPQVADLCRDKVATERHLSDLPMPEIEVDPARFAERLAEWGAAFLKPRYGALGRGVRRVLPGDPLPSIGPGAVRGQEEPLFLQRAVPPPPGWAGLCLRVLVQREPIGAWWTGPVVARASRYDPVANVERGAQAIDAATLFDAPLLARAEDLARQAADRVHGAIELGVDLLVDDRGELWLLELNHRPGGRLSELARLHPATFGAAHESACARPLRTLAAL